ncbi:DUF2461 domain-containing protein [Carboxylicivirga linearis]|uniref:DUF2461 domain-containing protein n=1 Tax=Carboxylicivirga linearis TaxID=1628157 RepID=A0ABS5JQ83_9BACT|nr:DUF2461 domain-containing protein [Carboxylicivirga linearis]MBS2096968.1 DUF2461 domain-containing protein [Carboxylicivirga linearis]
MIEPIVYEFLKQLKDNNNREWFTENKPWYQDAKLSFENSIKGIIDLINTIDDSIGLIEPKDCIFRIYRDTRFAKDKTPYKTNMGAYIVRGGRKSPRGGYYIHVEPGQSFIAGGIYCPPSEELKKVRKEVYNFTDEFKEIIEDKDFVSIYPELYQDKLKMAPKGFPKDFSDIDLLKYKSYIVSHSIADNDMTGKQGRSILSKAIKTVKPLNDFINRGLDAEDEEIVL